MRILKGIAITGLALLLAAAAQPVLASCGSATLLGTNNGTAKSGIWTDAGQWTAPGYYPGYLPFTYEPPVTANFAGKWWALGTGDPAPGAGDDSNTWTVDHWFYYYGPGYYGSFFAGEIFGGWGQAAQIDGCILNNPTGCTCILLTDEVNGKTFSALLGAQRDATGNTYYVQPGNDGAGNAGPIVLRAQPSTNIVTTVKNGAGVDVTVTTEGTLAVYQTPECDCSGGVTRSPATYSVYALEQIEGSAPPTDINTTAGWTLLSAGNPIGASSTVFAPCDTAAGVDLYIGTEIVFDDASGGGFGGGSVSDISPRIVCGANPTLADPDQPRIKPNRPVRPSRGRR